MHKAMKYEGITYELVSTWYIVNVYVTSTIWFLTNIWVIGEYCRIIWLLSTGMRWRNNKFSLESICWQKSDADDDADTFDNEMRHERDVALEETWQQRDEEMKSPIEYNNGHWESWKILSIEPRICSTLNWLCDCSSGTCLLFLTSKSM